MSKIGIGIITVQKRQINPKMFNLLDQPTMFYIYYDKDLHGCSYGRNECIKHLYDAGCDYIFLFDDDTYPTIRGWENNIIEWASNYNVDFLGMVDQKHDKVCEFIDNINHDTLTYQLS